MSNTKERMYYIQNGYVLNELNAELAKKYR